jgi:RecJ-like exonuclease
LLLDEIDRVAKIAKTIIREKNVKVFSQFDTDGVSSASILAKALAREGVNFQLRILKQLTTETFAEISADENDFLIFSDFGSGQLNLLEKLLDKTQILILDHHEPTRLQHLNLFHINPMLFGEEEMSASVVCYLFAKAMSIKNADTVDLAIIGAVGDESDENWKFDGMIKKILTEGEMIGKISVSQGLRLYGRNTRPIHKSLAYTFDPYIPGVSGSESHAVQFLSDAGIRVKEHGSWVRLCDLTPDEQQKLATAIIFSRMGEAGSPDDIFGDNYTLIGRPDELQDVRELSTLVNSCGRTNNATLAMRVLLEDYSVLSRIQDVMDGYRRMIGDSLDWVRNHQSSIVKGESATYVFAGDRVPESIIGTITSIMMNSNGVDASKPLIGLADAEGGFVKVSARISKSLNHINLKDIISKAARACGGEGGGHQKAAGGLIPKGSERRFSEEIEKMKGEMIGS